MTYLYWNYSITGYTKKRKQLIEKDSNKQIHRQIKIFCWGEQCY